MNETMGTEKRAMLDGVGIGCGLAVVVPAICIVLGWIYVVSLVPLLRISSPAFEPFLRHPEHILKGALLFGVLAVLVGTVEVRRKRWPVCGLLWGVNALLWLMWAGWEANIGGDAIRIYLALAPLGLLFLAVTCLGSVVRVALCFVKQVK